MTLHDEIAAEMHAFATAETGGLDLCSYTCAVRSDQSAAYEARRREWKAESKQPGTAVPRPTRVMDDENDEGPVSHHIRLPADVSLWLRVRSATTRQSQAAIVELALRALQGVSDRKKGAKE